ncbi:MAG: cation transporter [bacterium]|nr:cation transporter [bacterium]
MKKNETHNHSAHHQDSTTNIKTAFFLNLIFTVLEIIGGIFTNSIAIIADALHDLGDSLSLGFAWYLEKYSRKKRSKSFSYGYRRFSLLAALINSLILIIGSFFVLSKAIPRLLSPEPTNAAGMFVLAILGILVNGIAVLRLKKGDSLNEKVVSWHLLEDVFGWVAVLIVSLVNMFASVPILDPVLAILFTLIIVFNIFKNLKRIMSIFLQSIPSDLDMSEIEGKIMSINDVISVHDTHIWTMDGEYNVLTMHIVLKDNADFSRMQKIKQEVKKVMKLFNIQHTTVEFETEAEYCDLENC